MLLATEVGLANTHLIYYNELLLEILRLVKLCDFHFYDKFCQFLIKFTFYRRGKRHDSEVRRNNENQGRQNRAGRDFKNSPGNANAE